MWKPGSRSFALDRAQAVLSSRKSREAPAARTNSRTAVTDVVFSDLSDLSSVSSAPEQKFHLVGPAHGPGGRGAVSDSREKLPTGAALRQSPDSSSCPSSPFCFMGQSQACFSCSAPSPSRSPQCLSSLGSGTHHSSCAQVLSLEKLFPFGAASEDSHNASSVSSGHFRVNVMELDDLGPDNIDFNEDTRGKESIAFPTERPQQQKTERGKQEKEVELDYQSDFEIVGTSAPDSSLSQISEHIQGRGGDPPPSHVPETRTEYDYVNTFTDTSGTPYSKSSDGSWTEKSLSRSSLSPKPHVSDTSWHQSQEPSAKGLRDIAVQTHDAHISYSPSMLVLIETLKQQLVLTRQFISSSCDLHTRLVQSLEPPNYKYTTLEDTRKIIGQHRASRMSTEQALQEMTQEMRGQQHR